ncbi:MAG: 50S ribosomal protein L22 [Candidatus Korarchaeota archaeon]|nr:50S ribosomal protein L22 [Thermoproteota archaeon]
MPKNREGYTVLIKELPRERIALARGRNLPIKWKHAVNICDAITSKRLLIDEAIEYLKNVIARKEYVPYFTHRRHYAHRKGSEKWKWPQGGYPEKAARYILKILNSARANAEHARLDPSKCIIFVMSAHKGRAIRRRPDRIGPGLFRGQKVKRGCNIEVVLYQLTDEEYEQLMRARKKEETSTGS